jgi:hypothetical protein
MASLVTVAQSDSTNDGSGASTLMEPPQVDNATDDAIFIKVTQSLNNSSQVAAINVTTPTGYTLLTNLRDIEVRSWVYYKRSTGSETIPTVTSDTSARWTCTTAVVTDVDWANGGVVQHVQNTAGGDTQSLDLTTNANGTASAILCFYSVERRTVLGFRYPQTRPQTIYKGTVATGTSEGIDNAAAFGFDYMSDRSTTFDGPFWEANGGGDSLAINVEVLVQGNVVPLQVSDYIVRDASANSLQLTMNWCREICDSGKHIDGSVLQTYTFTSSDIDTATNQITITAHGMDESMVVRFSDGGGTAPGGLADDTFYYVEPMSANAIQLRTVNEDTDAISDYYASSTTKRPVVAISSTGSGTFTFTEARLINAGQGILDIMRPNLGNGSNVGTFSGSYVGDAGYNQNDVGTSQRFNNLLDLTGETLTFQLQINASNRLSRVSMTLIDEDGDWMSWQIWKSGISLNITGQLIYQFQVDQASVQALSAQSFGTFDSTRIRYLVITARGNNASANRFGAVNSATSRVQLGGPLTIINGQNANLTEMVELAESYTTTITKPSDLQVVSLIPLRFGNGISDVSFIDSEKSVAFPPLADGVNTFQNYLNSLGVTINVTATSTVKLTNSQVGASVPYTFDITAATGSTVDLTGNFYVLGTVTLDADASYIRQVYVGGNGITDNGAEIRNSTFIVTTDTGADNGMVKLTGTTDIESSTFELKSGVTTGHAIQIGSAGTYTFTDLTFNSFGTDGTNTAAIYNSSGGAVTINVFGGSVPTVRNSAGSTTTVNNLTTLTLTSLQPNSEVRVFDAGTITELAGVENSGTSFTANISAASVDIVIHSLGFEYQKISGADTTSNLTLPIQQRVDRNYSNP